MAFVAAGTITALSGTSTSVPIPSHSSGDLLCLIVGATASSQSPMVAAPTISGWQKDANADAEAGNASAVRATAYYKYGDGAESSVSVGTWSVSVGGFAQVIALSGRAASSPVDDSDNNVQESGTDIDSPAGTASGAGTDIVRGFIFDDDISTDADHDSDANWKGTSSGYLEDSTPGNGFAGAVSYEENVSSIGTSTYSSNGDDDAGVAIFIAFLPASGASISNVDSDYGDASNEFDYDENSLDINGSGFEASQGSGAVYISDASTLAGGANEVDISSAVNTWSDTVVNLDLTDLTTELASLESLGIGSLYVILVNNSSEETSLAVTVHRAKAFNMAASANITASGENTTAQLTAPSGKTTGDFGGGRIQDDENPGDAVDLASDEYREDEWSIAAVDPPDGTYLGAQDGETYQFRVLIDGVVVDTYTVTPEWTIGQSSITGTGATTEDQDTAAGSGHLEYPGSGATTEDQDTSAGAGHLEYPGSGATTEDEDVSAGSGVVIPLITGSGATTEDPDTSAGVGATADFVGSGATTEDEDTSAGAGHLEYPGTGATTEDPDVSVGTGTYIAPITGTGATTEDQDTSTGTGQLGYPGTGATTEDPDVSAGTGLVGVFEGSGATTEDPDVSVGTGLLINPITGTGTTTEDPDTSAGSGTLLYTGSGATTEDQDTATGQGFLGGIPQFGSISPISGVQRRVGASTGLRGAQGEGVARKVTGTQGSRGLAAGVGSKATTDGGGTKSVER